MVYKVLSYIYSQFLQQSSEASIVPISIEKVFQKDGSERGSIFFFFFKDPVAGKFEVKIQN